MVGGGGGGRGVLGVPCLVVRFLVSALWVVVRGGGGYLLTMDVLKSMVDTVDTCLVTLSLTVDETLKWLPSLPILMQESFRSCGDSVATGV